MDGFVLPGSPADVDPARYGAPKHQKTNEIDENRDSTDIAILDHAFRAAKPVLAICYGCQMLNVHRGGTLVQDIRSRAALFGRPRNHRIFLPGRSTVTSSMEPRSAGQPLARLNQAAEGTINSSHHQAIDKPGKDLRVTATATDGTIEGVEWTGDSNWIVGVQWHPERMVGDPFAERLFADFVAAARQHLSRDAHGSVVQKA